MKHSSEKRAEHMRPRSKGLIVIAMACLAIQSTYPRITTAGITEFKSVNPKSVQRFLTNTASRLNISADFAGAYHLSEHSGFNSDRLASAIEQGINNAHQVQDTSQVDAGLFVLRALRLNSVSSDEK